MFDSLRSGRRLRLNTTIADLTKRVADLEKQMSLVEGRSRLNAERIVRTHSSLQNVAEDFQEFEQADASRTPSANDA